jgi:hypothetical protein
MKDYIFLAVGRVGSASKDVIQTIEYAENEEKFEVLIRTLNKVLRYTNYYALVHHLLLQLNGSGVSSRCVVHDRSGVHEPHCMYITHNITLIAC